MSLQLKVDRLDAFNCRGGGSIGSFTTVSRTYGFGRFAMGGFQLEEPFIDRIEVNAPVTAKFKGGDLTIL